MVPANMRSKEPTKALLLSVCCFVKVDHLLKKRRFFPWNKIENHDFICSDNYHYSLSSTIPKVNWRGIMPFYYMALSHKDWELPNARIWLAEMDIDRGLDFPI